MRAEVVTLRLNQVRRQHRGTVAVIVGNSCGEGRRRDAVLHRIGHHVTQRLLILVSNIFKVRRQQQVSDIRHLFVSIGDFLQELRTNDAACTENLRDLAVVQVPAVLIGSRFQL